MSRRPDPSERARAAWRHRGGERPAFALAPGPGQRSVWDFPRPPVLESVAREVRVCAGALELARSRRALRVLETGGPPTYYVPAADVATRWLAPSPRRSFCEWKGEAVYWDLAAEADLREAVAWSYPEPFPEFQALRGAFSFYPGRVECSLAGERVAAQPGGFYGGWVTPDLVGPFKGEPGTEGS